MWREKESHSARFANNREWGWGDLPCIPKRHFLCSVNGEYFETRLYLAGNKARFPPLGIWTDVSSTCPRFCDPRMTEELMVTRENGTLADKQVNTPSQFILGTRLVSFYIQERVRKGYLTQSYLPKNYMHRFTITLTYSVGH